MKAEVKSLDGGISKKIDLPEIFSEEYRPDLIKKAVMALQSTRRQPHGTNPFAGICSSAVPGRVDSRPICRACGTRGSTRPGAASTPSTSTPR
jgi:hypothetical protein